eukprot:scpid81214/ scgid33021/ 52 kDa repressor of the inhibitor of the protein kinase; 58 kDa interferon-induced protein kinase-interacting protein; Death-associated protein 4; THAP domain-containing protein 0
MAKYGNFQTVVAAGGADVADQMVDDHLLQAKDNEEKLRSILDCVIFCGKQNIPLRGHCNETIHVQQSNNDVLLFSDEGGNPGNFVALLEFRAKAGDPAILRDFHLHASGTGGNRVHYCSATSQNELIDCCGQFIRDSVLDRVRAAPFFSLLADEGTDTSNLVQMPAVLRFVENYEVHEEFMGFVTCDTELLELLSRTRSLIVCGIGM